MIGYYNYTVLLTYFGMLFGFAGILYIWDSNLIMAVICLMIAGLCDMFDGKVASTMHRTDHAKKYGIQIDSLSDLICFGVLPALILFKISWPGILAVILPTVYLLSALIRLAWFNVDEEERQKNENSSRKIYIGLPVTSIALILPAIVIANQILGGPLARILQCVFMATACAFLSSFELKKPGRWGKLIMIIIGTAMFIVLLIKVIK